MPHADLNTKLEPGGSALKAWEEACTALINSGLSELLHNLEILSALLTKDIIRTTHERSKSDFETLVVRMATDPPAVMRALESAPTAEMNLQDQCRFACYASCLLEVGRSCS